MIQPQLDVYRIDMKYIRNLHKIDDRVLSVSSQIGKDESPFLGVIIMCNGHNWSGAIIIREI
jgi:protein AbiQ